MSQVELKSAIQSNVSALLGTETQAILQAIYESAEFEINNQISSMAVDPTTDPTLIQATLAAKRAEFMAEATIAFFSGMVPSLSDAIASAVYGFLQSHAQAQYIPGSLQAGTYPVVQVGPAATQITY